MGTLGIDLSEIKRWLQRGDIKAIAEAVGVNASYVSMVLSGKPGCVNQTIIEKALDKAIERKASIIGRLERLKQL